MSRDHPRIISRPVPSLKITRSTARTRYHSHVGIASSRLSMQSVDTHLLKSVCIRDAKEAFSVKPRFQEHFRYLVLDVEDSEEQNLIRLFPGYYWFMTHLPLCTLIFVSTRAKQFIYDAIAENGRVLVHCNGKLTPVLFCFACAMVWIHSCYQVAYPYPLHLSSCSSWNTIIWITKTRCKWSRVSGIVSRPMAGS